MPEAALPLPLLPLTVQLVSTQGQCWEAVFSSVVRNSGDRFVARSD